MITPRLWPSIDIRFADAPADRRAMAEDRVAVALDDCQPTAVAEQPDRWIASFSSRAIRDEAARRLKAALEDEAAIAALDLPDDDWAARSQLALGPVQAGRIIVTPPWHEAAVDRASNPTVLVVEPSMGFGTGHHATTRMCLLALQQIPVARRRVLDIGTGSGVLAMAAARLGASAVEAVDNDPDAVDSARRNIELNGLTGRVELGVHDFRNPTRPPRDLVLANLTGAMLEQAATAIAAALAPDGHLVLSGFTVAERDFVVAAFAPAHRVVSERVEDGWGCVVLEAGGRQPELGSRQVTP